MKEEMFRLQTIGMFVCEVYCMCQFGYEVLYGRWNDAGKE